MPTSVHAAAEDRILFACELGIFIQVPCGEVFEYVADTTRHPEWAADPLEIRHVAGPTSVPGATFESVAERAARVAVTSRGRMRILEAEPPHRLVYEVEDTTGRYQWTTTVAPESDGTRLTQHVAKLSGPWYLNLIQPSVIWPMIGRAQVQGGLENIKARPERVRR
jgi:uncharacterized protein YndB with AHSA1/START domain